jgi:hypothetical protein
MVEEIHGTVGELRNKMAERIIVASVYEAFYASEFPATSEPLLKPYSTLIQPLVNC